MLKRFSTTGLCTTGTNKTALTLLGTAATRGMLYDAWFSSVSTPADVAIRVAIMRCTAAGTGTSVTPIALDAADAAAVCVSAENHSAEPTYTAGSELFDNSFNQRATLRWVAAPGGEIIVPASANNGVGAKSLSVSSGTPQMEVTFHFQE